MKAFAVTSQNTLKKIWGLRKYKVFFILSSCLVLFFTLFTQGGMRLHMGFLSYSFSNGAFLALSAFGAVILPFLSFMLCSDLYASEMSDHTIKTELLRPVGKSGLYFAKFAGILYYFISILLVSFGICLVTSFFGGWADKLFVIFIAHIMSIVLCCVFIAFGSMVAVWTANASLTMFICILIYILLTILSNLFTTVGAISFTGYYNWFKMIMGSVIIWKNVFVTLGLLLSYIGVFSIVGQLLFDRRDAA